MATRTKAAAPDKTAEDTPAPDDLRKKDPRIPRTRVRAGTLRAALKDVMGVVEARNTIPILTHALFEARDQRLTLAATDLDLWAVRDCASDERDGPDSKEWLAASRGFACAIPAKALASVLAEIDGDAMVTIEAAEGLTHDAGGRVTIRAGRARFALNALPASDFPLPPPVDVEAAFDMPCSALADAFAAVDHAISTEETRYYLNGVYVHPDALALAFVTTDGHRLARLSIDGPEGAASFPAVIVAKKTVEVLEKLLDGAVKGAGDGAAPRVVVEAGECGTRLRFALAAADGGSVDIVAKAIDGTFPDYTRVIPADPQRRATLAREPLAEAVRRVAVLADGKSRVVKAVFRKDALTLSAISVELGEASEDVPCDYDGAEATFGFDSRYWREALAALASETVAMRFDGDAAGPVRLSGWDAHAREESGALVQVLMPCRV